MIGSPVVNEPVTKVPTVSVPTTFMSPPTSRSPAMSPSPLTVIEDTLMSPETSVMPPLSRFSRLRLMPRWSRSTHMSTYATDAPSATVVSYTLLMTVVGPVLFTMLVEDEPPPRG